MNSSEIGDRLGLLRDSCVSKYGRLEEITEALEVGEQSIREIMQCFPSESYICSLRVQLAAIQAGNAQIRQRFRDESEKHLDLQVKMNEIGGDLLTYMQKYEKLAAKVSSERLFLLNHHRQAMDILNMSHEQYLMSCEECYTLTNLIEDVESSNETTNRIDWLKKIIRATQIQRKEDESCLIILEKEYKSPSLSTQSLRR